MKIVSMLNNIISKPVSKGFSKGRNSSSSQSPNRSVAFRHVDVGSCNACEIEISSAFGPVYDASRFGMSLVASPRHADGLLVTGVVTQNMYGPLMKTYEATPKPKIIIACGDCAINGGIFKDSYGVKGILSDVLEVSYSIPGCPPHPQQIVETFRNINR